MARRFRLENRYRDPGWNGGLGDGERVDALTVEIADGAVTVTTTRSGHGATYGLDPAEARGLAHFLVSCAKKLEAIEEAAKGESS